MKILFYPTHFITLLGSISFGLPTFWNSLCGFPSSATQNRAVSVLAILFALVDFSFKQMRHSQSNSI